MAVTLKDIAERTGVSPSVVSTVLSGRDNGTFVSESTRRKVLQMAEMLNYTPVRSGRPRGSRRLRRQRAEHFIGVWDSDYSPATAFYVQNLQLALRRHAQDSGAEAEDDYGLRLLTPEDLPRLDALGIMGLILISPVLLPREAAAATIPCVMIGAVDNPPREVVQVHADEFGAGRLLGDYLWNLGHRRIAFLTRNSQPRLSRERLQGLQSVWAARQANPAAVAAVPYDLLKTLTERDLVRRAVLGLLGPEAPAENQPTALVCCDENVAALTAQTLAEIGCRVPGDVSLAGIGDTPRLAEALTPPLTTVRPPIARITQTAIAQLYQLHDAALPSNGLAGSRDIALPGELVARASCASPAPFSP